MSRRESKRDTTASTPTTTTHQCQSKAERKVGITEKKPPYTPQWSRVISSFGLSSGCTFARVPSSRPNVHTLRAHSERTGDAVLLQLRKLIVIFFLVVSRVAESVTYSIRTQAHGHEYGHGHQHSAALFLFFCIECIECSSCVNPTTTPHIQQPTTVTGNFGEKMTSIASKNAHSAVSASLKSADMAVINSHSASAMCESAAAAELQAETIEVEPELPFDDDDDCEDDFSEYSDENDPASRQPFHMNDDDDEEPFDEYGI